MPLLYDEYVSCHRYVFDNKTLFSLYPKSKDIRETYKTKRHMVGSFIDNASKPCKPGWPMVHGNGYRPVGKVSVFSITGRTLWLQLLALKLLPWLGK